MDWVWFNLLQPSAFAKIAVLISLAAFLHFRGKVHLLTTLVQAATIPAFMIAFIIVEPDFERLSSLHPSAFHDGYCRYAYETSNRLICRITHCWCGFNVG